jgi:hypothetical protein
MFLIRQLFVRIVRRVALIVLEVCFFTRATPSLLAQTSQGAHTRGGVSVFLRNFLGSGDKETRYAVAFLNLNRDRASEAIVYLSGDRWCGSGGCTMLILAPAGASYRVVTKTTITRLPIRVLKTRTNGWADLSVRVQGGGILTAYQAVLRFDGSTYPENPSTLPAGGAEEAAGTSVIDMSSTLFSLAP